MRLEMNTYKQIEPHTAEPDQDEIHARQVADRARIERKLNDDLWPSWDLIECQHLQEGGI